MISINGIPIKTQIARDDKSRAAGLMGVESMPKEEGMLFVFPDSDYRSFWMKNTLIPLSIAYIDKDYKIINIENMNPHSIHGVSSRAPALCALEMNRGWFNDNGVMVGDAVEGIEELHTEVFVRDYVNLILKEEKNFNILIPPPPPKEERLKELPYIIQKHQNPDFDSELQKLLDKKVSKLFNLLVTNAGYPDSFQKIKNAKNSIKPIIKLHKNYFESMRPNELASSLGIDFPHNYLESAQSRSYPSGHTTQAFYLAHILSEEYPELAEGFYDLAQMVADSRVEHGVHFPSDNEGGKILAQILFNWRR